jgi:hypothetical protein
MYDPPPSPPQDTFVDPDSSKLLFSHSSSRDKQLVLVNSMWHILVHEPGNERILDMCIEWMARRAGPEPPGESEMGAREILRI